MLYLMATVLFLMASDDGRKCKYEIHLSSVEYRPIYIYKCVCVFSEHTHGTHRNSGLVRSTGSSDDDVMLCMYATRWWQY